jgi:hypothetical protein
MNVARPVEFGPALDPREESFNAGSKPANAIAVSFVFVDDQPTSRVAYP